MAETEEHVEKIDEAQREMGARADEMAERGEQVDRSIDEAKSTHRKALDDDGVPTGSAEWENDEPDDGEGSGDPGFDDPEELDDDDDDLEDDDGYADDEDD